MTWHHSRILMQFNKAKVAKRERQEAAALNPHLQEMVAAVGRFQKGLDDQNQVHLTFGLFMEPPFGLPSAEKQQAMAPIDDELNDAVDVWHAAQRRWIDVYVAFRGVDRDTAYKCARQQLWSAVREAERPRESRSKLSEAAVRC